jgi:D-alanine-D-alanine ligase
LGKRTRVGLIFGGKSGEHEVSLASAQSVVRAIDPQKYDVVLIGITKDGKWLTGEDALQKLIAASPSLLIAGNSSGHAEPIPGDRGIDSKELVSQPSGTLSTVSPLSSIDVAFPLVHGPLGEDGTLQGLLELADIPYVGAGVASSAVGMDKAFMKAIFRAHNLPQVDWMAILRRDWELSPEETIRRIETAFGYPCFVKPANLGSSVGISKAHNWDELAQALANAAQYDRKVIAERAAQNARELECSVLGNEEPIASLPGEIISKREFYDYVAKYDGESGTDLIVPADIPPEITRTLQELAVDAFKAIDGHGMARVDFFLERMGNRILLNEINTIPGFTSVSMYPKMWEASGVTYTALIDRLIELALEHYAEKKRSKTAYQ